MSGFNTAVVEEIARKESFIEKCTGCNLCVNECSFLQRSGNPAELASGSRNCDPFECTLCGLCSAVCPFGVDPSLHFLEQRRAIRREKGIDDPRHAPLIGYERRGNSSLYNFYGLPEGCDTIFFPGCALPGTRPQAVWELYQRLKSQIPNLGIVLDCCLKPSHDLGREEHFEKTFGELRDYLYGEGIRKVLVACPNCNRIFGDYGDGMSVQTVYEILAELPGESRERLVAEAVFHDPCVARYNVAAQDAARKLVAASGVTVAEMQHSRDKTLCCGRGGGVNFVKPGIVEESVASRVAEAEGRPIVTYCAACAGTYAEKTRAMHLLDLYLAPREALAGKVKVSTAPMTYLNRILLKNRLRRSGAFPSGRGRVQHQPRTKQGRKKAAGILLALAALSYMVGVAGFSYW
jgi:Fe-S oxidoreductase